MQANLIKDRKVPVIFIVGGPGCGKGTQCERIVAKYGFTHLSSGDLLRLEVKSGSKRGAQLQKTMEAGELVPQDVVLTLIKEAVTKALAAGSKGFLIDGYPRDVKQGIQFEAEIGKAKTVIYFQASEETLVKRLMKRAQTRRQFGNHPKKHYSKEGKLININGEGSVEDIYKLVCAHIDSKVLV
ncbi:unnamed protein product [Caenorhabditis auriculariae]|uniref:Adenylate kinase isoenzyme 1 n=1 Tax=Caenorhabditis auriculariae TaxID=2777116 RepID=A0A8S1H4Y0_9PELO|nr:unnamed protein product [Caenorhabditis auriculariae]